MSLSAGWADPHGNTSGGSLHEEIIDPGDRVIKVTGHTGEQAEVFDIK